jgi:hypothetical protein
MTQQKSKQSAIFPDLPRDNQVVDKDGNAQPHWELFFDQTVAALQSNYSPEGLLLPPLSAADIATIQAIYTPFIGMPLPQNMAGGSGQSIPDISGAMVFDSTNRVPKVFVITYDGAVPPNIVTAAWKTYTLT